MFRMYDIMKNTISKGGYKLEEVQHRISLLDKSYITTETRRIAGSFGKSYKIRLIFQHTINSAANNGSEERA